MRTTRRKSDPPLEMTGTRGRPTEERNAAASHQSMARSRVDAVDVLLSGRNERSVTPAPTTAALASGAGVLHQQPTDELRKSSKSPQATCDGTPAARSAGPKRGVSDGAASWPESGCSKAALE
jgi:hypothetical protein